MQIITNPHADEASKFALRYRSGLTDEAIALRKDWVEALRGGEYDQTTGKLQRDDGYGYGYYCCLGVVASVCEVNAPLTEYYDLRSKPDPTYGDLDEMRALNNVAKRLGLTHHEETVLTDANDDGATFAQIADLIESTYTRKETK